MSFQRFSACCLLFLTALPFSVSSQATPITEDSPSATERGRESLFNEVIADKRYLNSNCGSYMQELSEPGRSQLQSALDLRIKQGVLKYLLNKDRYLDDMFLELPKWQVPISPFLPTLREKLQGYPDYTLNYAPPGFTLADRTDAVVAMKQLSTQEEEWAQARIRYFFCLEAEVAIDRIDVHDFANGYLAYAKSKTFTTQVGVFEARMVACDETPSNTLPNATGYSAFEAHIDFRNTDSVPRQPYPGRLVIRNDGKQRIFEPMKHVMSTPFDRRQRVEGLDSVMATIVFSIPDDAEGDVYWLPNKNSEKGALWCAHLDGVNWPWHMGR